MAKKYDIEVINAHWLIPQGFVAVLTKPLTKAKIVITIHGTDVFGLRGRFFTRIKQWTLKNADEVVVNSSATKKAAEKIYSNKNYHIIPMGIDLEKLPYTKQKTPSDGNTFNLLFVGRLSEEKGVIYLLRAIKLIKDRSPDIYRELRLSIVGVGPTHQDLKEYVASCDLSLVVSFEGWVKFEDLHEYYKNADLFIGPSVVTKSGVQEAFGLVFAESLAMNTPVLGTNVGGVKDIVKNGKNGFLVKERSPEQIAEKIIYLFRNPQVLLKLGKDSRRHIEGNFSWEVVTNKYKTL